MNGYCTVGIGEHNMRMEGNGYIILPQKISTKTLLRSYKHYTYLGWSVQTAYEKGADNNEPMEKYVSTFLHYVDCNVYKICQILFFTFLCPIFFTPVQMNGSFQLNMLPRFMKTLIKLNMYSLFFIRMSYTSKDKLFKTL